MKAEYKAQPDSYLWLRWVGPRTKRTAVGVLFLAVDLAERVNADDLP